MVKLSKGFSVRVCDCKLNRQQVSRKVRKNYPQSAQRELGAIEDLIEAKAALREIKN